MKYDLQGTTMQLLNIQLDQGETLISESGRMVFMSENVKMETKAKGGFWASLKRKFAGESFFLVNFTSAAGKGLIGMGSEFPGKIIPMKLNKDDEIVAQKDAFLCSETSINFDATFTKRIKSGLFGGEGLVLIKLRGPGLTFFNVGGEISKIELENGQKIRVDTGNLAMMDSSVEYDIERIRGVKNIIWGGEGLFIATCTGPGRVWVQSMPVNELAAKLSEYMPRRGRSSAGGFVAGSIIGSMMRK